MAMITHKGNPVHTIGELPALGAIAPDFTLTQTDLTDITPKTFAGKNLILNIFPSLDTSVCARSVRRFNEEAAALQNTVVLCISMDLPFAQGRFCVAEGLKNVVPLSAFRSKSFGTDYGVIMTDGPLAGLLSRAIVVINSSGKVIYSEQVPEIAQEPNYAEALKPLRN